MRGSKNVLPEGGRVASRARLSDIQRPTRMPSRNTSPCVGPLASCGDGGGATEGMVGANDGGRAVAETGSAAARDGAGGSGATGACKKSPSGTALFTKFCSMCDDRAGTGATGARGTTAAGGSTRVGATLAGGAARGGSGGSSRTTGTVGADAAGAA